MGYRSSRMDAPDCFLLRGRLTLLFFSLFLLLGFTGCGKNNENAEVFAPRIEEAISPNLADRKRERCSAEKVSFGFLKSDKKFIRTDEFRNFFDCANYDFKYQGLEPLVHSKALPDFLDNLVDSVNSISNANSTKNIKATLEPWFTEHEKTGESKIDHILPAVAKVIKHAVFRKALPLLASLMEGGSPVWDSMLESFSYLVYNQGYPNIWADFRKLFNVRTTSKKLNHLAITTRDFFAFLRDEQEWSTGERKTNARALLEMLEGFNHFKTPPSGFLSLVEYANNRDIFGTLYQEAGGAVRGEDVLDELNGSMGADPQLINQIKKEKINHLFAWDKAKNTSPLLDLIALVVDFNQKRPDFLPSISRWFSKEENQNRMHKGMAEFVARRLVKDIIIGVPVSRYLQDYYRKVLNNRLVTTVKDPVSGEDKEITCSGLDCEINGEQFAKILQEGFQHEGFQNWLVKWLESENTKKFKEQNARLLLKHGGLQNEITELYQRSELFIYSRDLIEALRKKSRSKFSLRTAINSFAKFHILEEGRTVDEWSGPKYVYKEKEQNLYDHFIDAWLRNSSEAWGESIVLHEAFRVIDLFLSEFIDKMEKDKNAPTLSQLFFNSTYTDPVFMEKLIYEAKRSGVYEKIEKNMVWLKTDFATEVFKDERDLESFRKAVDLIPTYVLYIESGMARSGVNLTRALSERDKGYLIRTYVDFISEGYKSNWIKNALPLWKNFIDFMDVREQRVKVAVAEAEAEMSEGEKEIEKLREARRQSDGVDALKRVFKYLFRPIVENDWNTSLAGKILVPLRELVKAEKINETESFILTLADRTIKASDKEIEAVYDFFSPNDGSGEVLSPAEEEYIRDAKFRKNMAELIRSKSFPKVLVELDHLFKDKAVVPSLDFLAAKIDEGEIQKLLELIRKLLGIKK